MDVGLDELIKNKWKTGLPGRRNRGASRPRGGKKDRSRRMLSNGGVRGKAAVIDARAKINARKRGAVRDAREKLNALQRQKDARLRLSSLSTPRLGPGGRATDFMPGRTINNASRQLSRATMDSYPYPAAARRNARPYSRGTANDNLMDVDRRSWDPASLPQLEVLLIRPNSAPYTSRPRELRTNKEDSWLRPSPALRRAEESIKSRLEPLRQEEGYRIVVSNLQPTVTHEDIKELFEDIGPLIGSRVVRPGTAEVVYRDLKDAIAAVDAYHNRQLDGQPMKCLLVKPSSSSNKAMVGTKGMVVPDISTIHKALFMK